jgi:hypothetical protein
MVMQFKETQQEEPTPKEITVYATDRDTALLVLHYFWKTVYPDSQWGSLEDPAAFTNYLPELRNDPDRSYTPLESTKFTDPETGEIREVWGVKFRGNHDNLTGKATNCILNQFYYYPIQVAWQDPIDSRNDRKELLYNGKSFPIQDKINPTTK